MTKKTTKKKKTFKSHNEEYKVSGKDVVETIKKLVKEGNIRHILVKNNSSKTLFQIPLTAGVIGVFFLPVLAGFGAIAALVGDCTISVERNK